MNLRVQLLREVKLPVLIFELREKQFLKRLSYVSKRGISLAFLVICKIYLKESNLKRY